MLRLIFLPQLPQLDISLLKVQLMRYLRLPLDMLAIIQNQVALGLVHIKKPLITKLEIFTMLLRMLTIP